MGLSRALAEAPEPRREPARFRDDWKSALRGNSMINRSFIQENEAARVELSELIARLDERSFNSATGSGWTIATTLCHLAFWDQRVLF